jgi:hypothetical protein
MARAVWAFIGLCKSGSCGVVRPARGAEPWWRRRSNRLAGAESGVAAVPELERPGIIDLVELRTVADRGNVPVMVDEPDAAAMPRYFLPNALSLRTVQESMPATSPRFYMTHVVFQASDPLWERVLVAATGPLVTVLVGGLIVWGITSKVQEKRDTKATERAEKRADAETARETLARDDALRHELVTQMTESASSFYLLMQHYGRVREAAKQTFNDADPQKALQGVREKLDAQYLASRATGDATENRLLGYFESEKPRNEWHRVQDLLTVRYFQLIDKATDALYDVNEGERHTGLSVEELRNPRTILTKYRAAIKAAVDLVFTETLRARS